jgi:hypothetical protein
VWAKALQLCAALIRSRFYDREFYHRWCDMVRQA